MKLLISFCALLLSANSATALAASYYTCNKVGGIEEWAINIDLKKNEAGFFDNNTWTILPLKQVLRSETNPPQQEYVFEGKDTGNGGMATMKIFFNLNRKSASLVMDVGTLDEAIYEAEDGCVVSNSREM